MRFTQRLLRQFQEAGDKPALIVPGAGETTYAELRDAFERWKTRLDSAGVPRNSVVSVRGDFDESSIGLLLALLDRHCIYVPIATPVKDVEGYLRTAEVEYFVDMSSGVIETIGTEPAHDLLIKLRDRDSPGLILFSSGSTGAPKAAVHDLTPMLEKYQDRSKCYRTIAFLLFDHIGGFNTLMFFLANTGTIVCPKSRDVYEICKVIEDHRVQVLPTSPTFLNMILTSRAYEEFDLSSLELITYGTEPMQASTLKAVAAVFPEVTLKQTYGLSEVGILRTHSKANDSLWMKIGDSEHRVKVKDGILWIKSEMSMLGYLNAPSPFDDEGWFDTQDTVEVDGEYIKILGRESDVINVGGEKVYPAEVESVILELPEVCDVAVFAKPNPIVGQIVACRVYPTGGEQEQNVKRLVKKHCIQRLERFKRPRHIEFSSQPLTSVRFKRVR